nr:metal-sensitive transcriptional regulator [Ameyamaea chiangmaiensis]
MLNRVRRIEGQVAGLAAMLDNDRYCLDILTQVSAVKSALDGLAVQLLANHADGCLRRAIGASEADGDAAIAEVMEVIRRMIR